MVILTLDFTAVLATHVPGSTQQYRQHTGATSLADANEIWPSRLWTVDQSELPSELLPGVPFSTKDAINITVDHVW